MSAIYREHETVNFLDGRKRLAVAPPAAAVLALLALASTAWALDPEGCLTCHRYQGLARLDPQDRRVRLYYVDPNYYNHALGPHSRLFCSQCHPRSEVEVVPHKQVSPVNCGQVCHVIGAEGLEINFSHDRIAAMLEASVHTQATMQESNRLLGNPVRDGQSSCLLCHDEPRFRRGTPSWIEQAAPVQRCNVCHDETLPVNTSYFYWHVLARSQPARTHADTVRVCAICHHNESINARFKHSDTIASYLFSFHGKAMLLGSERTAACLNCHVGKLQNVHLMMAAVDPNSPTNAAHLSDTCRSPACHALAGAQVSAAAVHLNLASGHGIEYFVALVFIAMIVFTFGPSLILSALELTHIALGREDPGAHHRTEVAAQMLETRRGRALLSRFSPHQRVQHWVLVALFSTLVVTGFPLKFADRAWAAWIMTGIGGIEVARPVHRIAGLLLIVGMLYHFVWASRWDCSGPSSACLWPST
jgi:thiosulfate reductase cytochrome b subunit